MKRILSYYLVVLLSSPLVACGFQPMAAVDTYSASGQSLPTDLASVDIVASSDRRQRLLGQHFRISLEDLIHPNNRIDSEKQYQLHVQLSSLVSPGFIAPDGKAQRFIVSLRSIYELRRLSDQTLIERGKLHRNSSYSNLPNSYFSTYVAEQDTLKRLAEQLAEEYRMKLASLLTTPPAHPTGVPIEPPEDISIKPKEAIELPRLGS